jgi:Protein of unknown function (DUF1761)
MLGVNFLAVVVGAVAVFVASSVWYIVFGPTRMRLRGIEPGTAADVRPPPWKVLAEVLRSVVVAYVLARFIGALGVTWMGAVGLGLLAWIGFPVMILLGSVQWEDVPWKLAAIHAGDWLVKLLILSVILGVWR